MLPQSGKSLTILGKVVDGNHASSKLFRLTHWREYVTYESWYNFGFDGTGSVLRRFKKLRVDERDGGSAVECRVKPPADNPVLLRPRKLMAGESLGNVELQSAYVATRRCQYLSSLARSWLHRKTLAEQEDMGLRKCYDPSSCLPYLLGTHTACREARRVLARDLVGTDGLERDGLAAYSPAEPGPKVSTSPAAR